jgi:Family of unknown function (DUF6116)
MAQCSRQTVYDNRGTLKGMGFLTSRVLMPIVARLGSRTILGIGGTLFVLNMLIPDPLPLVDEFLILAGTILLSRMAKSGETGTTSATGAGGANGAGAPKHVGKGSTRT